MRYQCRDCSYQSDHVSEGLCTACGSRHIRTTSPDTPDTAATKVAKPYRLALLSALWLYLLVVVLNKLIN